MILSPRISTNLYSPGVYIEDFKVKESQFTIRDIGIINTTVDDFISKVQLSDFTLSEGKLYPRLKGSFLNKDVEIAIHPSKNNDISELYIYFSISNLKGAVALCNQISEQLEDIYGAMINTYFFDTTNFSSEYDHGNLVEISEHYSPATNTYVWLITGTKHEVINLCLEYLPKKRSYVPVLKVKVKKLTGGSLPRKRDILFKYDILLENNVKNKPPKNSKFLGVYTWNIIEKERIRLISPVGKLEVIKKRSNYSKEDICHYNKKVQESYFKVQNDFVSGLFYDLSDTTSYASYAFILLYSILDAFKYNDNEKDVLKLINQIEILCICCPAIKKWLFGDVFKIYQYLDDNAKLQLIEWCPDLIDGLPIFDYAKIILKRDEADLGLLKEFSFSLDNRYAFCIGKFATSATNAKRYKISNDRLRQDIFEILLIFLRKIGGLESAAFNSIRLICVGNREPSNRKEERKIRNIYCDIMRPTGVIMRGTKGHGFYVDIIDNIINQVKLKNNIVIDVPTEIRWLSLECVGFEQYLEEAITEYYYDKEPQKGYIPVPRKKKVSD